MSLFIGNVSKKVSSKEFEEAFKAFGKCKIDLRVKFAFVQYESERCAQNAKEQLQNTNMSGLKLNIEWSKNSGRFSENGPEMRRDDYRRRSRSKDRYKKEDRWRHRSPSYQKDTPDYTENQYLAETFVPQCPRDQILLAQIKSKLEQKQKSKRVEEELEAKPQKAQQPLSEGQAR